jgi:hypothetical protein
MRLARWVSIAIFVSWTTTAAPPRTLSTAESTEAVEFFLTEALKQLRRHEGRITSDEPLRTVIENCPRYQEILLWKAPRPIPVPPPTTWEDPPDLWQPAPIAMLLALGCGDAGAKAVVTLLRECLEAERDAAAATAASETPRKRSPEQIHASDLGESYLYALRVMKSNRLPDALVHIVRIMGELPINEMKGVDWQDPVRADFESALRELVAKKPHEADRVETILKSMPPRRHL